MDMKPDVDPQETKEWLDAIDGVLEHEGPDRAHFLIEQVIDQSRRRGAYVPFSANTAYVNTIPVDKQPKMPGDQAIEEKIRVRIAREVVAVRHLLCEHETAHIDAAHARLPPQRSAAPIAWPRMRENTSAEVAMPRWFQADSDCTATR